MVLKYDLEAIGLIKRSRPRTDKPTSMLVDRQAKLDIQERDGNKVVSVHNWNGDLSPAVHQYDRLLEEFRFTHDFLGA